MKDEEEVCIVPLENAVAYRVHQRPEAALLKRSAYHRVDRGMRGWLDRAPERVKGTQLTAAGLDQSHCGVAANEEDPPLGDGTISPSPWRADERLEGNTGDRGIPVVADRPLLEHGLRFVGDCGGHTERA